MAKKKFHYGQAVRITGGSYKGRTATVYSEYKDFPSSQRLICCENIRGRHPKLGVAIPVRFVTPTV